MAGPAIRTLIIAFIAVNSALVPTVQAACTTPFVKSVLARHGGLSTLERVRTLRWHGTAVIHSDQGAIEIAVSTSVKPFVSARSESWLRREDPSRARVMILEQERGWLERGGTRSPMPPMMFAHERAQFAIYALMLLVPLCDPESQLIEDAAARSIVVSHPRAPTTTLFFDAAGYLTAARNSVPGVEAGAQIEQTFRFSAERVPASIAWPRKLHIEQNGKPYFDLSFDRFETIIER